MRKQEKEKTGKRRTGRVEGVREEGRKTGQREIEMEVQRKEREGRR